MEDPYWPPGFFERDPSGYRPTRTFLLEEPSEPIAAGWAVQAIKDPKSRKRDLRPTFLFAFATEPLFNENMQTWMSLGKPEEFSIYFEQQGERYSFKLSGKSATNASGEEVHEGEMFLIAMSDDTGETELFSRGKYGARIYYAANPDETIFRQRMNDFFLISPSHLTLFFLNHRRNDEILRENRWFDIDSEKNAVIKDLEERRDRFSERTAGGYNQNREEEVALVALNLQALQRLINAIKRSQGKLPEESMEKYLSRMLKSYKKYTRELLAYVQAVHAARERGQAMRVRRLVDVQGFPVYVPPGGGLFAKRPARDWEAEFEAEDRQADDEDRRLFEEKRRTEQERRQPRYIVDADEFETGVRPKTPERRQPGFETGVAPAPSKPEEGLPKVPVTPGSAGGPKKQKSASPGEEALDVDAMIAALASVLKDPEVRPGCLLFLIKTENLNFFHSSTRAALTRAWMQM